MANTNNLLAMHLNHKNNATTEPKTLRKHREQTRTTPSRTRRESEKLQKGGNDVSWALRNKFPREVNLDSNYHSLRVFLLCAKHCMDLYIQSTPHYNIARRIRLMAQRLSDIYKGHNLYP